MAIKNQYAWRALWVVLCCFIVASPGLGQLRAVSTRVLPLGTEHQWHAPRFAPDGRSVFMTTVAFDGIWRFDLDTQTLTQVTADARSGYAYSISPDGATIAYRRTINGKRLRDRRQEIVVRTLATGSASVTASGKDLSTPVYAERQVVYSTGTRTVGLAKAGASTLTTLLGIERTKIALIRDGAKVVLDPFPGGSYIWPALSPDRTNIVAVEMQRGAFVADVRGEVLRRLGRRNAPVWTRNGRWIVYMDDHDDGQRLISSDIAAVSADGRTTALLTSTADRHEGEPNCSPVADQMVFATSSGEVVLLVYREDVQ